MNFTTPLYPITDRSLSYNQNVLLDIEQMCQAGCKIIQLREKNLTITKYILVAKQAVEITKRYNAKLIINDSVEVAEKSQADGVHLGQTDGNVVTARKILGEAALIGASVSSFEQAKQAVKLPVDYLGAGAVFATATKPDATIIGLDGLKAICEFSKIPVVAIGGINHNNARQTLQAGASAVAVVSQIVAAENIPQAVQKFFRVLSAND
jgi:thiamine-phosphate pyrophosphorylase